MTTRVTKNYCVIGAGHGGQALAAYLQYLGNPTVLYNRTKMVIDPGIRSKNRSNILIKKSNLMAIMN